MIEDRRGPHFRKLTRQRGRQMTGVGRGGRLVGGGGGRCHVTGWALELEVGRHILLHPNEVHPCMLLQVVDDGFHVFHRQFSPSYPGICGAHSPGVRCGCPYPICTSILPPQGREQVDINLILTDGRSHVTFFIFFFSSASWSHHYHPS